jgi:hypothetical protein
MVGQSGEDFVEEWREISAWSDYEISSAGNVRRAKPYYKRLKQGLVACFPKDPMLKPQLNIDGYRTVGLKKEGMAKYLRVAKLVCEAFHGTKPSPRHEVAHRDGTRTNDRANNLRWATPEENWDDRRAHGTAFEGEKHPLSILTDDQVRQIRGLWLIGGYSQMELGHRFGVSRRQINGIINRRTWRHIP